MINKQNITNFNKQGQRHGYWELYHITGNLAEKGTYVNGKREGFWMFQFETNPICYKGEFKDGNAFGLWLKYDGYEVVEEIYCT